jgi:hypothetical protein
MNPYLYSMANPTSYLDPSGHFATDDCDPPYDGYMEGFSLTYSNFPHWVDEVASGERSPDEIFFAQTVAIEWVYDFEHTQWAVFKSASQVFETNYGLNLSETYYQGTIDGFRNYDDISGYAGPFYVRSMNGQLTLFDMFGFGATGSLANPLENRLADPIEGRHLIDNLQQAGAATVLYNNSAFAAP